MLFQSKRWKCARCGRVSPYEGVLDAHRYLTREKRCQCGTSMHLFTICKN
ncbi:MAG: hypothetical protein ACTSRS_13180 [Candidatus Helarchaeota archaeon]